MECQIRQNEQQCLFIVSPCELWVIVQVKKGMHRPVSHNKLVQTTVLNAIYNYEKNEHRSIIVENIPQSRSTIFLYGK